MMYVNIHGYRYIKAPTWFTGATFYNNQAKEHHITMCLNMGITEIPRGYAVHHIDEDKLNNVSLNLMLLPISRHTRLHNKGKKYGLGKKRSIESKKRYSKVALKRWADPSDREKRMQAMRGKRKVVECPHCGKSGGGGNMKRYHFDNCKAFYFGSAAMRR